ncbi:hypothetical protein FZI27_20115 [Cronobacter sakazakii]|nr:hypothetical protein FZI27_20115 [Cronobacter sakazakii]
MKISRLIILAVPAIFAIGCGSNNKLPQPKGERLPLNQLGIPAELAIAIAREKNKTVYHTPVSSLNNSNKTTGNNFKTQTVADLSFSHAKKTTVNGLTATRPVTPSTLVSNQKGAKDPFGNDINKITNASVSPKFTAPIVTTGPATPAGAMTSKQAVPVSSGSFKNNPLTTPVIQPKVNLKPIKLNVVNTKTWVADSGSSLWKTIIKWSEQEKCNSTDKWNVIWPVEIDYPIDYRLTFTGNFYEAVTKLFDLYKKAEQPLYIDIYSNQCIISVSATAYSK